MSIAALHQVYDEVRRLMIAGSDLAAGDFRLKKLVDPLRKSAAKAPVFGKVADAVDEAIGSTAQTSARSLLELGALVTAILYTQGETGGQGDVEPLETEELDLPIGNTSARVLKPLIDALGSTGPGRLEIVRDAHERRAFADPRLIHHAVGALDDPYVEIADYVARHVLPLYGKALYPMIRSTYTHVGKGAARRLRLMHELDAERTREVVTEALEEGAKEVKVAAIECLQGRADAIDHLLEQIRSRAQDVRHAAWKSLAAIDEPVVIDALIGGLGGKDVEQVAAAVARNPNEKLAGFLVAELERTFAELLQPTAPSEKKTKKKDKEPAVAERFAALLPALHGRRDERSVGFLLRAFDAHAGLSRAAGEAPVHAVCNALLRTGARAAWERVASLGSGAPPGMLSFAFTASCLARRPSEVFDAFAPIYRERPAGRAKAAALARQKAEEIGAAVLATSGVPVQGWQREESLPDPELDPRWLDAAVAVDDEALVLALARSGHAGLLAWFTRRVEVELKKPTWSADHRFYLLLAKMIELAYPQVVPVFVKIVERSAGTTRYAWDRYYLLRLIPELPVEAVAPLQALVPGLPDAALEDYGDAIAELQRKHEK